MIPSMPERKDSRERVMCASWEVGVRFSEMARWRSRRESLMWSAKRNSWDGFDIAIENSALCRTIRVLLCLRGRDEHVSAGDYAVGVNAIQLYGGCVLAELDE